MIGKSVPIRKHGLGYLKLAFAANKGKKGWYSLLSQETLRLAKNSKLEYKHENFPNWKSFQKGNLYSVSLDNEGCKGHYLVLATSMHSKVQIQTQYKNKQG